jgi:hypothetical protein
MLWDANANHTTTSTMYTGQCLSFKVLNRSKLFRSPRKKSPEWTNILIEMFLIVLILITVITVDFASNFNLQNSADTLLWGM